jgi:hypothetical protein
MAARLTDSLHKLRHLLSLPDMTSELRDQRVPVMMTASELKAVDDWSFAQRIRSRGDAIRRLIQAGLEAMGQTSPQPPAEPRKPRASAGRSRQ